MIDIDTKIFILQCSRVSVKLLFYLFVTYDLGLNDDQTNNKPFVISELLGVRLFTLAFAHA